MTAALLLLLQAAIAAPPERIDLLQPVAAAGCEEAAGEEIVVCGGRTGSYRVKPMDGLPQPALIPKAAVKLFGGKANAAAETEGVPMPNGNFSNRLMARIKLPF